MNGVMHKDGGEEEEEEGQTAKVLLNVGSGEWEEDKPHISTAFYW